jgi:predicted RNase H-like HicB family nuclease
MSVSVLDLKNLSTRRLDSEGNSVLLRGSSLVVSPIIAVEISKDVTFRNLSKFTPKLQILKMDNSTLLIEVSLQIDGGYVAKTSVDDFDAVGEGDTETEAIEDIISAIKLLKETVSQE